MRPSRSLLFGLVLAALPIQRTTALPSQKSTATATTTTTTTALSTSTPNASSLVSPSPSPLASPPGNVPVQAPMPTSVTPEPVSGMAYASDGRKLYIQGGKGAGGGPSYQFLALDLTSGWSADSPAWTNLTTTGSFSGGAGAIDHQGDFLVTGQENGTPGFLYVYRDQNQSFTADTGVPKLTSTTGPLIVSEPTSGDVFFLGDGVVLNLNLQVNAQVSPPPKVIAGEAASWSSLKTGILSTYHNTTTNAMDLQVFVLGSGAWTPLNTNNIISQRSGHCFVPNSDGSKFYLFGGANKNAVYANLYIYTVATNFWEETAPVSASSVSLRETMACVVAGDTLIVWGGGLANGSTVDVKPLLFDTSSGTWVASFAASVPTSTASTPISPTSTTAGKDASGHSNVGAIVGGVIGGIAAIALVAGLFIVSRNRNKRFARKGNVSRDMFSAQKGGGIVNEGAPGPMEMGGYTTIPAPPASDVAYQQAAAHAMQPPYAKHVALPVSSAPGYGVAPYYQQQAPPIPSRPSSITAKRAQSPTSHASSMNQPPIIQSPFEVDHDPSPQHPLLHQNGGFIANPLPPPISQPSPYHDRLLGQGVASEQAMAFSPALEPATVDLIPISASEAGEGSQISRSNSIVSSRSVTRPVPSRSRSIAQQRGVADNRRGLLEEPEVEDSRRDSQESLEYLDI